MGSSALPQLGESPTRYSAPRSPRMERLVRAFATFLGIASLILGTIGATIEVTGNVLPWLLGKSGQPNGGLAVTAPNPQWASFASQHLAPAAAFQASYVAHGGLAVLGPALTPALPLSTGWIQFYRAGALYVPAETPATVPHVTDALANTGSADSATERLITGYSDPSGEVALLPVLPMLLAAGSEVGIGDPSASLTYVDLRAAVQPDQEIRAPSWYTPDQATSLAGTFVPEGKRDGAVVGHLIPPSVWAALNQASVAPDGWRVDFGNPLTEALTGTAVPGGHLQQLTVQVFDRGALVLKTPAASSSGTGAAPVPQPLSVGLDYLETFGPPLIAVARGTHMWGTQEAALYQTPGPSSEPVAHIGLRYPMMAANEAAQWRGGRLWYNARWQNAPLAGTGWVAADNVSFVAPDDGPVWEGFEMLNPDLAAYLSGLGYHVGALVYDVTRQRYYFYNDQSSFIVASSVKVPIMLSLLTQMEQQGRQPTSDEMYLLTTMIENSNNASAQALYEEIGDAQGLTSYMQRFGVTGVSATPFAWGWSTITPQAMVQLLTMLDNGQILTPQDRALALSLMENIQSDQQIGVGTTAPAGATVAMKDGWVTGPDNLWVMNTSGIVYVGSETYIISVYTTDLDDLPQGWDITQHVCGAVAQLLP